VSTPAERSGNIFVCPRCGTPTPDDGAWCDGCGLNLRKQGTLPMAEAYAAKQREQQWLAHQEAKRKERQPQAVERSGVMAERKGDQQQRKPFEARREVASRTQTDAAELAPGKVTSSTRRHRLVAVAGTLVLLAGTVAAALTFRGSNGEPRTSGAPAPEPDSTRSSSAGKEGRDDGPGRSEPDAESGSGAPKSCGTVRSSISVVIDRGDVSCGEARDVITNFGNAGSSDGGVTFVYKGWECGGASVIGCRQPGGDSIRGQFRQPD